MLVYAHDVDARFKHGAARDALRELWHEGSGVLSPQILEEFYVNVTRKIATPLATNEARLVVSTHAAWCIDVTSSDVMAAFRIEDEANISFWDALVVASAAKAGASRLLSEHLDPGQATAGVRIENPFARAV